MEEEMSMMCKNMQTYTAPIQNMLSCRIKEALSMMPYTFAKYKYGGRRFLQTFSGSEWTPFM